MQNHYLFRTCWSSHFLRFLILSRKYGIIQPKRVSSLSQDDRISLSKTSYRSTNIQELYIRELYHPIIGIVLIFLTRYNSNLPLFLFYHLRKSQIFYHNSKITLTNPIVFSVNILKLVSSFMFHRGGKFILPCTVLTPSPFGRSAHTFP